MRKKKLLFLCFYLLAVINTRAYDVEINGIYYNFYGNKAEVTYSDSVKYSGAVHIPKQLIYNVQVYQVANIGYKAFAECHSLTSVSIPDNVTSIGDNAFAGCSSLTSVNIPDGVRSIGVAVFAGCSLTSVKIPNSVTSIGDYAFSFCRLSSVNIPSSVTSISEYAFFECNSLTSVSIPNSVKSISKSTFQGCDLLTSVNIPNSVTSIDESAFSDCWSLTSVNIGNSVTSIGSRAFNECESLTSVNIPDSVRSIGDYAFYGCRSLTSSITIPDSVKSIGDYAFDGCWKLCSAYIGGGKIGSYAFRRCPSLTSLSLGNNVTSIGESAFQYCHIDEIVSYIEKPFEINESVFQSCFETAVLYVPKNKKNTYMGTPAWNSFPQIIERSLVPLDKNKELCFVVSEKFIPGINLYGVIIDDIFFNISQEVGGYNDVDGCITIRRATSDEQVRSIVGMDVDEPEVKQSFCGFILLVPAGDGCITIDAEAMDGMTLKVKIGDNAPIEQVFDVEQLLTVPYSVTTSTYVYVYAGKSAVTANAKRGTDTQTYDGMLKIYGIALGEEKVTGIIRSLQEKKPNNSPCSDIYNLAGQRLSKMQKGINIVRGKKLLVR